MWLKLSLIILLAVFLGWQWAMMRQLYLASELKKTTTLVVILGAAILGYFGFQRAQVSLDYVLIILAGLAWALSARTSGLTWDSFIIHPWPWPLWHRLSFDRIDRLTIEHQPSHFVLHIICQGTSYRMTFQQTQFELFWQVIHGRIEEVIYL